jgi:hypothetical protein
VVQPGPRPVSGSSSRREVRREVIARDGAGAGNEMIPCWWRCVSGGSGGAEMGNGQLCTHSTDSEVLQMHEG